MQQTRSCSQPRPSPDEYPLVIADCRVLELENGVARDAQTVVVAEGRIRSVGPGTREADKALPRVSARGLIAVPGLIDMHTHTTMNPYKNRDEQRTESLDPAALARNVERNFELALDNGITTVRDLGSALGSAAAAKHRVLNREMLGPTPFVAGRMITARGGHGTEAQYNFGHEVDGADAAREAVRAELAAGADLVKLATCAGWTTAELNMDELTAATDEAHSHGARVAVHAHFREESIANAINSGCDTLEHGCMLNSALIAEMKRRNTFFCPTLSVFARAVEHPENFGGRESRLVRLVADVSDHHREAVVEAHAKGVKLLAGTDAGLPNLDFGSLHEELARLCALGLSALGALRTATIHAAEALGMEGKLGLIRVGAAADIVFINGDNLGDLSQLRAPVAVMSRGRVVRGSLAPASEDAP